MNKSLLDLSGKIDPLLVGLFKAIDNVATANHVCYFVVGATARDVILEVGYGIKSKRATVDTDLGVEVSSWDEFETLKTELTAIEQFKTTSSVHRLLYKNELPLDIVPFGPLEKPNKEIIWPPDNNFRMNVLGFEDAYRNAQTVRLRTSPILDVQFATPVGLALLKIIAWSDRSLDGNKDAQDLAFLLRYYLDAGNQERLYKDHEDLLADNDFDYERSGARLLGRDLTKIMLPETREVILQILDHETDDMGRNCLVEGMMNNYSVGSNEFEKHLGHLKELKAGIQDFMS